MKIGDTPFLKQPPPPSSYFTSPSPFMAKIVPPPLSPASLWKFFLMQILLQEVNKFMFVYLWKKTQNNFKELFFLVFLLLT